MANVRGTLFELYCSLRGSRSPRLRRRFLREAREGDTAGRQLEGLARMLLWCREHVPHYAQLRDLDAGDIERDPARALRSLPVLTKEVIRSCGDALHSDDLASRRWYWNTSGGSTGEPIRLVQDREYQDQSMAASQVFANLIGRQYGEPEVRIWGSERDIIQGTQRTLARIAGFLQNTRFLNAFRMTEESMAAFIASLNRLRPRLIVAYAQAAYELASYSERSGNRILPQRAMITSAGTLFPFMRQVIERAFGCPVFNRYGSREVGDIACEVPGREGLWVSPRNAFVEILDARGEPEASGAVGDIAVTSLSNFAMPLLRYAIGDRGALARSDAGGQVLGSVTGRSVDTFKTAEGALVDGEYFTHVLYFRPWVKRFQVVQKGFHEIVVRVVPLGERPAAAELEEMTSLMRKVMGPTCDVRFEFVEAIVEPESGKYRYTLSEVR